MVDDTEKRMTYDEFFAMAKDARRETEAQGMEMMVMWVVEQGYATWPPRESADYIKAHRDGGATKQPEAHLEGDV